MTPKQAKFVQHYLISNNATQAAIAAGYAPKFAERNTYQITRSKEVADAIAAGRAKGMAKAELTAERVIEEIRRVAMLNSQDLFVSPRGSEGSGLKRD